MKLAESGFDCILRTDTHRKGRQMNFVAFRAAACCHLAMKGNSAEPSSQGCGCGWVRRRQSTLVWLSSALPSGLDIHGSSRAWGQKIGHFSVP